MRPLLESVGGLDFEEDGSLLLDSAVWDHDGGVSVRLRVRVPDRAERRWRVTARRVRAGRLLHARWVERLSLTGDHPLLLPHVAAVGELYFVGRPVDVDATVGRLYAAHRRVAGDWFGPTAFLNATAQRPAAALLAGGHGLLAKGPTPLVEAYAAVLRAEGIRVTTPPARPPVVWLDDGGWVRETGDLAVLLLDESYLVAEAFEAVDEGE